MRQVKASAAAHRLISVARRARADGQQSEARPARPFDAEPMLAAAAMESCRRRGPRIKASADVRVKRRGHHGFDASLRDLSAKGCRVDLIEMCQDGEHVIARFPQLQPLGARVCWTAGTTVGIEFRTPFHPAVFDSLLGKRWLRVHG